MKKALLMGLMILLLIGCSTNPVGVIITNKSNLTATVQVTDPEKTTIYEMIPDSLVMHSGKVGEYVIMATAQHGIYIAVWGPETIFVTEYAVYNLTGVVE